MRKPFETEERRSYRETVRRFLEAYVNQICWLTNEGEQPVAEISKAKFLGTKLKFCTDPFKNITAWGRQFGKLPHRCLPRFTKRRQIFTPDIKNLSLKIQGPVNPFKLRCAGFALALKLHISSRRNGAPLRAGSTPCRTCLNE